MNWHSWLAAAIVLTGCAVFNAHTLVSVMQSRKELRAAFGEWDIAYRPSLLFPIVAVATIAFCAVASACFWTLALLGL